MNEFLQLVVSVDSSHSTEDEFELKNEKDLPESLHLHFELVDQDM